VLFILSPAKRLDFSEHPVTARATRPRMGEDTAQLAAATRRLTKPDLKRLMGLSDDLAKLNRERFLAFDTTAEGTVPAALAFAGDVYQGLKARELDAPAMDWAQDHLRILSGLYGVLRPLDAIQPYRLEMGTRLSTRRGRDLYAFWGDRIAKQLDADLAGQADPIIVNLASEEYFGAVDRKALKAPVIDVRFEEERDGHRKVLSFFAKQARGRMARWAIDNRIERAADLTGFAVDGYRIDRTRSTDEALVFWRHQPPPVAQQRKAAREAT
jgi:cytoplasmic iron level regulating protein YaaA (DUF328/UPF0246 family)